MSIIISIVVLVVVAVVVAAVAVQKGVLSFLRVDHGAEIPLQWEDLAPTPLGEKRYTPQGLVHANGRFYFANTWKNTQSRVYEYEGYEFGKETRYFDMPSEAVHTSGFGWDGEHLWGVDYKSNLIYCIDLEPSMASGKVVLVGTFDSTLKGASAGCILEIDGKQYLAISDFMNSRQTIIVDPQAALADGSAAGHILFSYRNEGFSQGLEFIDGYLYESENKVGVDIINKMDINKLRETGDARQSTVAVYPAPSEMVEDLAWDGEYLVTTDESTFRFYRTPFPPKAD